VTTDAENHRRHGISPAQAALVIAACAIFMLVLLAMLPAN
jgi:hypothetical protein